MYGTDTSLFAAVSPPRDNAASRLAFSVQWMLGPARALLVGIVEAARRGLSRDAIDGSRTPTNFGLQIDTRDNQNSVERQILAAGSGNDRAFLGRAPDRLMYPLA